jgi:hypothetical protein
MDRVGTGVVLSVLLACAGMPARAQNPATPRSRVVLTLDKNEFFLGENVLIHYCIEALSTDPVKISYGGDYRGASRSLRFKFTVTDASGTVMPDPDPSNYSLGGLGGSQDLIPGNRWCQSLPLMRYARIDREGTYDVRVVHDMGLPAGDAPEGRISVRLLSPTAAQAEQVVASMIALPPNQGTVMGSLSKPYADFSALRYGVYLQPLLRRAEAGDTTAISGIGSIPTPDATRALIALVGNTDPALVRIAARTLNTRLPDPALDGSLGPRGPFDNDMKSARRYLINASWRDEFAPEVRAAALKLLTATETEDVQLAAFMLEAVGGPEAASALSVALTSAIEKTPTLPFEGDVYPRPRGSVRELMRAADILVRRGYVPPEPGDTPGSMALWLVSMGEGARPQGWQANVSRALVYRIPYIRELAMERLPADVPVELVPAIRTNLGSTDIDVQITACNLADRAMLKAVLTEVTDAFRRAKEFWTLNACGNGLSSIGSRFDYYSILAARIPEPGMTREVMSMLISVFDSDGSFIGSFVTNDAAALSARWRTFLAAHRADIEAGRPISLDEPDVTPDLITPGMTLGRTGKPDWPAKR